MLKFIRHHFTEYQFLLFLQQLEKENKTSTYTRIRRILQNSIEYANVVFSNVEFSTRNRGRGAHRGIKFQMTDYLIDTDEVCHDHSK